MEMNSSLLAHLELLKKGSRQELSFFVETGSSVRYKSSKGLLSEQKKKLIKETKETKNLLNILAILNCVEEERLEEYYQGGLSLSERIEIFKHLKKCKTCRYRFDVLGLMDGEQDDVPKRIDINNRSIIKNLPPHSHFLKSNYAVSAH